jgi:hypothetical protein
MPMHVRFAPKATVGIALPLHWDDARRLKGLE